MQAWGHHHQASGQNVENLQSLPYDREEWRPHLGSFPRVKCYLSTRINYYANSSATFQLSILLLSGDINPNPGPAFSDSNKCSSCCRTVARNHRALVCSTCKFKYRIKCENVPPRKYKELLNATNIVWSCTRCHESLSKTQQPVLEAIQPNRIESTQQDCHFSELNMRISCNNSHLKVAHIDVNGLTTATKFQEVQLLLEKLQFDVLGITESKLTSKIRDEDIMIPGYKFFRKDRPVEDGGGGCVLYCAESLDIVLIQNCFPANLNTLEAIWAELKFHSQNLALSIMYRPPKDTNFFGMLERQLNCICKKKENIFIMGDFNSNVLRNTRHEVVAIVNDSDHGRKLTNVLRKFALTNVIKEPTRITETTKTLIDLSITSDRTKVVKARVFDTCIADHRLIYTVLKLSKTRVPPVIRSVIDWKNCNQDTFRQQVAFILWYGCNVFDDIDDNN